MSKNDSTRMTMLSLLFWNPFLDEITHLVCACVGGRTLELVVIVFVQLHNYHRQLSLPYRTVLRT